MKTPLVRKNGTAEVLPVLGTQVRFLCEGSHTEGAWSMMEVTLPLNGGPPLHEHPWDEAYYVVSGEVRFQIGQETQLVRAGDFLYAPGGVPHAFHGAGAEPARVLVLDAPAAAEGFFREASREVKQIPQDLPKVPAIGLKHGLKFLF